MSPSHVKLPQHEISVNETDNKMTENTIIMYY